MTDTRLAAFSSALAAIGLEIDEVQARTGVHRYTITLSIPRQRSQFDGDNVRGGRLLVSSRLLDPALPEQAAANVAYRTALTMELLGVHIRAHLRSSDLDLTMSVADGGAAGQLSFDRPVGDGRPLMPDLYLLGAKKPQRQTTWPDFRSGFAARKPILFWRGSTTGGPLNRSRTQLLNSPRVRACRLIRRLPRRRADCRVSTIVRSSGFNLFLAACELRLSGLMAAPVPESAFASYQMTIDLPGNTAAWGACYKYLAGCLVLRPPQSYELIYSHRLEAWTHYVPVAEDFTDLEERLDWVASQPDRAAEIAWQGRECLAEVVDALPATLATIFERHGRTG